MEIKKEKKLGLALSGGGFRASLFHIGTLAALAEYGLLNKIEVISCVSGGSIIGAYYYLFLKQIYENKTDNEISTADFINLVNNVLDGFLKGVQKNIRMQEYSNFFKDLKMIKNEYSNSDRIAELYDEHFYNQFSNGHRIQMRELIINPKDFSGHFSLRKDNKLRCNRIPMLVINASTLNTGKNWQFTAIDMGERDSEEEIEKFDKNYLFKSFKYNDPEISQEKYRKFREIPLSVAVAASACVPGIFTPLPITELYPNATPRLVDGGVYDNQGLSAILYENCTDVIISDASGQLKFQNNPSGALLNVVLRTNTDLMNRIRNLGLESILLENKAVCINKYTISHLLEDIEILRLSPGQQNPTANRAIPANTPYGVLYKVQELLSVFRTDLDTFTDTEAYSLMYSSYRMTQQKILTTKLGSNYSDDCNKEMLDYVWKFKEVSIYAEGKINNNDYLKQLEVSSKKFLKAFFLQPVLIPLGLVILTISALPDVAIGYLIHKYVPFSLLLIILFFIILYSFPYIIHKMLDKYSNIINYFKLPLSIILSLFFSILFTLNLKWVDPFFIKKGKLK